MKFFIFLICLSLSSFGISQNQTKKVLFLGNSYTQVNNLPQLVANVANSTGNTLLFDSNTPGGYTLNGHSTNATSLSKIGVGNWDYVVLQEQSQLPSFSDAQVETQVFPYAQQLNNIINTENPCAETIFYMTWGRKNGDASNCAAWPPVCTYEGMDNLLSLRYKTMATNNNAILSPVGAVWKYLRQNFPSIELYQADESHPSIAGSYAAACCFYTTIFRNDPTLISFNSTLSASDANSIKNAVKLIVFDDFNQWHIGEYDPMALYQFSNLGNGQVSFVNQSTNATDYLWDFGDGTTSTEPNPIHTYTTPNTYVVTLQVNRCGIQDVISQTVLVETLGIPTETIASNNSTIYPNPTSQNIFLKGNVNLLNTRYFIFDALGKTVKTGILSTSNQPINLEELSNGFYILKFDSIENQTFKISKH